jgi:hypothetical protein
MIILESKNGGDQHVMHRESVLMLGSKMSRGTKQMGD